MKYGTSRPWTNWEAVLLRMYERRMKIFQIDLIFWKIGGSKLPTVTVNALRRRYLIERTLVGPRGTTWSLTNKGREAAKALV